MSEATQKYVRIPLSQGKFAIIDAEDLEEIGIHQWVFAERGASRNATEDERKSMGISRIWMHRQIMRHPRGLQVDHANGDRTDNSRDNLRVASQNQNVFNTLSSVANPLEMRGVVKIPNSKKRSWYAAIQFQGKKEYLGSFSSPKEASDAYNKRGRELHGEFFVLDRPPLKDYSRIPIAKRVHRRNQSSSGFRGVYPNKYGGWDASVKHQGKVVHLGSFVDPQLASSIVEAKIKELRS